MPQYTDYRAVVCPWIVVHLYPNMQRVIRGRFRNASDADGYAKSLKRLTPDSTFVVAFDPPSHEG